MRTISSTLSLATGWIARCSIAASHLLLAAGVALGIVGTYGHASDHFAMGSYETSGTLLAIVAIGLALASLTATIHLARRKAPINPRIFLPVLVVAGFVVHLILIIMLEPRWGTDYLRYWLYAAELVQRGEYSGLNAPYYSRSLFVPYPIISLFGPDATFTLKLTNILLLGTIQVFTYDILRRVRSHQAAQAGSLILLAAPLPAYVTLIPSHDLWGTFFLTTTVWLTACAIDSSRNPGTRWYFWTGLAALAGIVAFMTEVQRNIGLIFCAAFLLSTSLGWIISVSGNGGQLTQHRRSSLYALCIAAACLATFLGSTVADRDLRLNYESRPVLTGMKFAANAGGMGSGTSDWFARFRDRFAEKQASADETADFARSSALSSWALQPVDRARRLATHAMRLFGTTYPRDWDWPLRKLKNVSEGGRQALIFYADIYGLAFGVLLLVSLLKISGRRQPAPVLINTLSMLLVALSLSLLLLFENKPYNIFPIWVFGALAIGYVLYAAPDSRTAATKSLLQRVANPAVGGTALIITTAIALPLAVRASYTVADGRLLSGWSLEAMQATRPDDPEWQRTLLEARPEAFDAKAYDPETLAATYINQSGGDGERIQKYSGDVVTRMQFPAPARNGDSLHLSAPVCTGGTARTRLEFFVYSPPNPRINDSKFTLDVAVDGRESAGVRIPLHGRNFQRFIVDDAFSRNTCHQFSFHLHAQKAGSSEATTTGPFIEIWMPRLIR